MSKRFDVFISYRKEDVELARTLRDDLREAGLSVWFDQDQVRPGTPFSKALNQGLEQSNAVVLLVGRTGIARWMEIEARQALLQHVSKGSPVIPVILPGVEKPNLQELEFLEQFNWIDCNQRPYFRGILDAILWGITGRKISRSQMGEEYELLLPRLSGGERRLKLFTIPSRGDQLVDLTWETFGKGIEGLADQIRNYGMRFTVDACFGVNDAGMVMATFLNSAVLGLARLGYLRMRWRAGGVGFTEECIVPPLPEEPTLFLADFEVKSGRSLTAVVEKLESFYVRPQIYFAVLGALTEQPDAKAASVGDLVAAEELEKFGLARVFIACTMRRPGIEPPFGLR